MNEAGLINRNIVKQDGDHVFIVETWDLTAPGCPYVSYGGVAIYECWKVIAPEEEHSIIFGDAKSSA